MSSELSSGPQLMERQPQPSPHQPIWKKNERRVYLGNFLHMTMYTMCLGGIFDLFLYNLSQEQETLQSDPIVLGNTVLRDPGKPMQTFNEFVLTFRLLPFSNPPHHKNDSCWKHWSCASTIIRIIDQAADGSCCEVGGRIPALYFGNSTYLSLDMDSKGQNESMGDKAYLAQQRCWTHWPLEEGVWHDIKVKSSSGALGKGQFGHAESDGGLLLFVNGHVICEVPGTKFHTLPDFKNSYIFFGSLPAPRVDFHPTANVQISDVKYGRPSSNLFVGQINSLQGILSMVLMYPIGWIGDKMNRYHFLRFNLFIGFAAAIFIAIAVVLNGVSLLYTGIIVFTFYQQCISAMITTVLADNVEKPRRTKASANYKTFSALAMSLAPAIQLIVLLVGPVEDSWTASTFNGLLLPGWIMLPFIGIAIFTMVPVGVKISGIPNTDDATERRASSPGLSEAWLNEVVVFKLRRRFVVALSVNVFFIMTLFANGMTVRYFNLYFTQILRFSPINLCILNASCRLWIAVFAQVGSPLARLFGRCNLAVLLHVASALFTVGIYGAGLFEPGVWTACICYAMRFACLHSRDPVLYSMTIDCVPQEQRSRWASLNSLRSLSFSASAVLGGYLADHFGYDFSFNITVASLLGCTVFFIPAWVWFPRKEAPSSMPAESLSPLARPSV